jgi:hypothetical protein
MGKNKTVKMRAHILYASVACAMMTSHVPGCDVDEENFEIEEMRDSSDSAAEYVETTISANNVPTASSLDHLSSCQWRKGTTPSSVSLYVECPAYAKPISGGCYNDSPDSFIEDSHPFENDALNLPDDGEAWYLTDGVTGWRCHRSGTSGTMTGTALCCGEAPVP